MQQLSGQCALLTGASRGIGPHVARALAGRGVHLALAARSRAPLDALAAELRASGVRAIPIVADLADAAQREALVARAAADLGAIDILVNNAGIASRGQTVEKTDPAELERVVRVHALGPHYLCKLVVPGMKAKGRGDIVMISSVATLHHAPGGAPYNMGKAAMEALAFTLAKEVRHKNIRVNVVAPGLVETEMGRRLVRATQGVEDIRTLDKAMPFGRVCQPEDVANTVRFLVSERASYVTGEKLNVHGGGP